MSSLRVFVLAFFVSLAAVGCGSTGGTIGGFIPAPKFTKGTLAAGRYMAKDKSFSVAVPFPPGSAGHAAMEIVENSEGVGNVVAFSSPVHPGEVYRVTTFADVKPANRLAETTVASYRKQMEAAVGTPLRAEKASQDLIDGMLANSRRDSQSIRARAADGAKSKGLVSIHSTHFLQRSTRAAFIAVHRSADASSAGAEGGEARVVAFLKSFRLR
jgi:uncharacterized protein involved in exopolysaccharide biosynthesis